jgi:hypothetical protein
MSMQSPAVPLDGAHAHTINIFVNDAHYMVTEPVMTGAQIAQLGGVPEGNQIFLEVSGLGEDRPVGRNEQIEMRSGMRFYDVPAGNLG